MIRPDIIHTNIDILNKQWRPEFGVMLITPVVKEVKLNIGIKGKNGMYLPNASIFINLDPATRMIRGYSKPTETSGYSKCSDNSHRRHIPQYNTFQNTRALPPKHKLAINRLRSY